VLQLWNHLSEVQPLLSDPIYFLYYHRVFVDQAFNDHRVRDEPEELTVGDSIYYRLHYLRLANYY
jgi:hypothetical protein